MKSAEAALAADDAVQCLSATSALHRISLEHSASTRRRSLESSSTISSSSPPPPTISSTLGQDSAIDILLALAAAPNLSVRAEALGVLWNLSATTAGQEAVGADAPRTALVAALAAATRAVSPEPADPRARAVVVEALVGVLRNLAVRTEAALERAAAGAVPPLLAVVDAGGGSPAVGDALLVVWQLAGAEEGAARLLEAGAAHRAVDWLGAGAAEESETQTTVSILCNLTATAGGAARLAQSDGAVPALARLLSSSAKATVTAAAACLANLASHCALLPHLTARFRGDGAGALLAVLEAEAAKGKALVAACPPALGYAATALLRLASSGGEGLAWMLSQRAALDGAALTLLCRPLTQRLRCTLLALLAKVLEAPPPAGGGGDGGAATIDASDGLDSAAEVELLAMMGAVLKAHARQDAAVLASSLRLLRTVFSQAPTLPPQSPTLYAAPLVEVLRAADAHEPEILADAAGCIGLLAIKAAAAPAELAARGAVDALLPLLPPLPQAEPPSLAQVVRKVQRARWPDWLTIGMATAAEAREELRVQVAAAVRALVANDGACAAQALASPAAAVPLLIAQLEAPRAAAARESALALDALCEARADVAADVCEAGGTGALARALSSAYARLASEVSGGEALGSGADVRRCFATACAR